MKILFIISGGLDSATALYELKNDHEIVEAVTFDYGQRHRKEIECAQKICSNLNIAHKIINIQNFNELLQGSSLTTPSIQTPHGHYEEESMKQTIVPNRNAIMMNIAAGYAISKNIHALGIGVHAGDHFIYPDCRPEFIKLFQDLADYSTKAAIQDNRKIKIETPLINLTKKEIVLLGNSLKAPLQLTHSCYSGTDKACGVCDSCLLRLKGFEEAGISDPIKYK